MNEKILNLKINGISVQVPDGSTVLDACKKANVNVPTLCYLKEINEIGACRMCLVEIKGVRPLVTSCVYPAAEGMEVITHNARINKSRKTNLELLLSNHVKECLSCKRNLHCKLQDLAYEYGCDEFKFEGAMSKRIKDESSHCLVRDSGKCIVCKRCSAVCNKVQTVKTIAPNKRGFETVVGCAFNQDIAKTACVGCGQCTLVCPTGALMEKDDTQKVADALANPELITIVAPAPAVRISIAEEFGNPIGTFAQGKLASSLRALGFKYVFDVDFAADLTIMEEASEFLHRVQNGGTLPLITSCSPGWVNFLTAYYPEMIPNLSTAKSPQQMLGALTKTYFAEKLGVDPRKIFFASIMPCTAKKSEINKDKDALRHLGIKDTDATITVRELARMIKKQGIDFNNLPEGTFDSPLGDSTGAAVIFGTTGGVMEAALRTAADVLENRSIENVDYTAVRGTKGIKEASLTLAGKTINVAVASGLNNARKILDDIKAGKKDYHFIEIMACPGGCVNGGGQPYVDYDKYSWQEVANKRASSIYSDDKNSKIRKSHENPAIIKIYNEYLQKPGSHKAHELLHTTYDKRNFI